MNLTAAGLVALLLWTPVEATPVAKTVSAAADGRELLSHGDLEVKSEVLQTAWAPYAHGYTVTSNPIRSGSQAVVCENPTGEGDHGLGQSLKLDRRDVRPLLISGWSRAEGVVGAPSADYSLYVDVIYQDGTTLWGRAALFSTGTHDWERRELRLYPEKPVKNLNVYALFRSRKGKVWFDDISVKEAAPAPGLIMFDGAAVRPEPAGRKLEDGEPRLQVRDVIADSSFYLVPDQERATIPELELTIRRSETSDAQGRKARITVTDTSGRDRAITLYYALHVATQGLRWHDDVRTSTEVAPHGSYQNSVYTGVGATGLTSRYPFACVSDAKRAWSLIVPEPRVCRLACDARTSEFYAAFDLALTQDSRGKGSAEVTVYSCSTPGTWGMRETAERFYALLPQYFADALIPRPQGNWMAFTKISSVPNPEDFGFRVHEGDNDVRWDNDHGIGAYVYVEPMTWWKPMAPEVPRTYDAAMKIVNDAKADEKSPDHDIAWAVWLSCTFDADGRYHVDLLDAPWCNGAVFGNSADPDVPETDGRLNLANLNLRKLEASFKAAEAHGGLAGVYLDSLEGWGMLRNFRREHFAAADLPITFDTDSRRPVILNAFSTQEWTEHIYRQMHKAGKRLMANAVPYNYPYLALPLDLMGTETNWQKEGRFVAPEPRDMYLRRTLAWQKPYMFLMNTRFETWTAEMTEQYMRQCLFYGMFPGFFSENAATNVYFAKPDWYERDRPLFRRYMPIITRVAEAGWEPIPRARASRADVWVERWGGEGGRPLLLTLMNTGKSPVRTTISLEAPRPGSRAHALLADKDLGAGSSFEMELPAGGIEAVELR